jgi:hypothetical protein
MKTKAEGIPSLENPKIVANTGRKLTSQFVRFELLTELKMSTSFWVVTQCGLVGRYQKHNEKPKMGTA